VVKIEARLAKGEEPKEGGIYKIVAVEEVKTAVQGFNGYRVLLKSTKKGEEDVEYATMLWKREAAGAKSKLGAFLAAFTEFLGDEDAALETDNWINHTIRIVSWKPKDREIKVLE